MIFRERLETAESYTRKLSSITSQWEKGFSTR